MGREKVEKKGYRWTPYFCERVSRILSGSNILPHFYPYSLNIILNMRDYLFVWNIL